MKYRIDWTEIQGYYTIIEAASKEEALEMFDDGDMGTCEATDFCEVEQDSIEIKESE